MTTAKRITTTTIESRQRTVIRQTAKRLVWCEFCAAVVEMRAARDAAIGLGITEREIFRRLEQGKLHFLETETGEVFICADPQDSKRR